VEDRPDEQSTAARPVRIPAWGCGLLLVVSLLLGSCAPSRLADLPDRPAGPIKAASDDEVQRQAISALRDGFLQRKEVGDGHQPVAPTFVTKATRFEAVRLMLSISRMGARPYDLDAVYRQLDPSFQIGAQRLRAIGTNGELEFEEVLKELASSLGACVVPVAQFASELRYDGAPVIIVAPTKGERRIVEKALTHLLGDVSLVQDLVRGSVAVDHPDDVRIVADRTLAMLRERSIEIVEVEDHFTNVGSGGYRDFQINFRLPRTRIIGELQLHVKDLLVVKQRVGHGVYERARLACAAMDMGIMAPNVSVVCARNAREMAASYNRAYRRSSLRPRIRAGTVCRQGRSAGLLNAGPWTDVPVPPVSFVP